MQFMGLGKKPGWCSSCLADQKASESCEQLWTCHEWGSHVLSTDSFVLTIVLRWCVLCVYL